MDGHTMNRPLPGRGSFPAEIVNLVSTVSKKAGPIGGNLERATYHISRPCMGGDDNPTSSLAFHASNHLTLGHACEGGSLSFGRRT